MIFAWPQKCNVRSPLGHLLVSPGNRSADLQDLRIDMITTGRNCLFWHSFYMVDEWTWVSYISNVLSIKTILFDILDFWYQLVVIRFVKTLSKRCMSVSFMKISACWLLHRLIKFNKICREKRPAKPRPNLRTSFCRGDLKNTQPHLKVGLGIFRTNADSQWNPVYNVFHRFCGNETIRW